MQASRFLIAGAVAALLQIGAAVAQTPPPPDPNAMPSHPADGGGVKFDSLDTDKDGRISKTEAKANDHVNQQFAHYDKNGNGYIEKDEVMSPPENPTPKE